LFGWHCGVYVVALVWLPGFLPSPSRYPREDSTFPPSTSPLYKSTISFSNLAIALTNDGVATLRKTCSSDKAHGSLPLGALTHFTAVLHIWCFGLAFSVITAFSKHARKRLGDRRLVCESSVAFPLGLARVGRLACFGGDCSG